MPAPADDVIAVTEKELGQFGYHMDPVERRKAESTWSVLRGRLGNSLKAAEALSITPSEYLNAGFKIESVKTISYETKNKSGVNKIEFSARNVKGHALKISGEFPFSGNELDPTEPIRNVSVEMSIDGKMVPLKPADALAVARRYSRLMLARNLDDDYAKRNSDNPGAQSSAIERINELHGETEKDPYLRGLSDILG